MPMEVKLTLHGADKVERDLGQLAGKRLVDDEMRRGIGMLAIRSVQRGMRQQRSPSGKAYPPVTRYGSAGQRLEDTGRLINSITYQLEGDLIVVGTNLAYARVQHEETSVLTPKHAKYLAIPLIRKVARAVASGGGFRAAFPDAFVFKARSGNLFLAHKARGSWREFSSAKMGDYMRSEGSHGAAMKRLGAEWRGGAGRATGKLELLAILKSSVTVHGTGYMGLSRQGETDILAYATRMIAKRVNAGGGTDASA